MHQLILVLVHSYINTSLYFLPKFLFFVSTQTSITLPLTAPPISSATYI
nr:MAG TPA: hypothetical protein [Caudoviricetes sp.]